MALLYTIISDEEILFIRADCVEEAASMASYQYPTINITSITASED